MNGQEQTLTWPLMHNNVDRSDLDALVKYLQQDDPRLTHGPKVREFEELWAQWVGTKYSVMVNSGSSANELTMLALRHIFGGGDVIVPPLTWVSDIAAVIHAGLRPVFVDIDPVSLGMDIAQVTSRIGVDTRAVFLTHVLGLNAVTQDLITACRDSNIRLIEDVCESHGAVFEGRRCGSIGYASNFSFYYAHHLTTIEGGAICTNDEEFKDTVRMLRSHGMVRESESVDRRTAYAESFPDLNPDFIFAYASHNHRPTELNGVLGLAQLPRLDEHNEIRRRNFRLFMSLLDPQMYRTWFDTESSSNYAFILVLQEADFVLRDRVEQRLLSCGIEFRRGLSGGGNQLRQPYLRALLPEIRPEDFPNTEHVHNFGWYIGNYPDLGTDRVEELCNLLNSI